MPQGKAFIGTSGWVYKHWRGIFYPPDLPQKLWLPYFAERFQTVEVNSSFYRMPRPEAFAAWRATTSVSFRYAVKATLSITHYRRLRNCEEPLARLLMTADQLGEQLGPILFQFPRNFELDYARLADFLPILPRRFNFAFEFRHQSWFVEEVRELLDENGMWFCIHDAPGLEVPHWVTGAAGYWRFHGNSRTADGHYPKRTLAPVAREMQHILREGKDVYVYFNNDAHGAALNDALVLRHLIEGA